MMRTGTTYLQNSVFPFFRDVHYIHKKQFYSRSQIVNQGVADRYLISYELFLDESWERIIGDFAAEWPFARPIVVLRKHSEWLESEYKRLLKNGMVHAFADLWDPSNPGALCAPTDIHFYDRIGYLTRAFDDEPILLKYDDLRRDGREFITNFAEIIGATIDRADIDLNRRHTSYSDKQLKALRVVTRHVNIKRERDTQPKSVFRVQKFLRDVVRYGVIHAAGFLPGNEHPLIPQDTLQYIDDYYYKDWNECMSLVARKQWV